MLGGDRLYINCRFVANTTGELGEWRVSDWISVSISDVDIVLKSVPRLGVKSHAMGVDIIMNTVVTAIISVRVDLRGRCVWLELV